MCGNDIPRRLVVRVRDDEPFRRYDAPVPVVPQPWIRFRPSKDLTYTRSIGRGRYGTYLPAVASRFPDLLSRHDAVDLRARYALTPRTVLELRYCLEDYGASDWAFDRWGWPPRAT